MEVKLIASNRKAFHDFFVTETVEAGLSLVGTEVKALRDAKANLTDGWVDVSDPRRAFLRDVHIGHYSHGNRMNHGETRPRQLLLKAKEMVKLQESASTKGVTLLPLKIYFKGRWAKVEIGLARAKKQHDKRATVAERDANRDIARALRQRNK